MVNVFVSNCAIIPFEILHSVVCFMNLILSFYKTHRVNFDS